MKKNNLITGAFVLTVGSVLAKVFSAIYRIVLTRILGGEGIGLYQLIFPIYSLCVVIATAGLPMAISKVVSRNQGREGTVLKKSFLFTSLISLGFAFILLVSAKGLANLQGQPSLSICYLLLAPTIILVGASSVLRGYFQGKHNFVPSSVSNISEQFLKMCVGLVISLSLVNISLLAGIVGAITGIIISELVSLIILLMYLKKDKVNLKNKSEVRIKDLVKDIIPITLTNVVLPISTFIDSLLVVNLLSLNFTNKISVFMYGIESGAVSSLVSLPTIFSFAIASVILPNIANAKHIFNKNYNLTLAVKLVLIITIPCVICFTIVPNRLIEFLYQNKLNSFGINGVALSSKLLAISGFGVVFLALNQVYSSSLQAIDERYIAVRNLIIGVILKFIFELVLMPSRIFNIYALAIANTVCYVLAMVLNHLEIKSIFKLKLSYNFWAKLILCNCIMLSALVAIMSLNGRGITTIIAVLFAGIAYLFSLFKVGIFTSKDRAMIKYKV